MMNEYILQDGNTREDLGELIAKAEEAIWPGYILNERLRPIYDRYPSCQFALMSAEKNELIGFGNSVPLGWSDPLTELPEEGWDWALRKSLRAHPEDEEVNLLCALQLSITPDYQSKGYGRILLRELKSVGRRNGFSTMIAPVRPSTKTKYPLTPIDHYIRWKNPEGLPFDPWLRVHARAKAEMIKVCHRSMIIQGSLHQWKQWTGMDFPETGDYVVPGALNPVSIDVEKKLGTYTEPNVWMLHRSSRSEPVISHPAQSLGTR